LLVLTVLLLRAGTRSRRRGYSVVGGKQGNPRLVRLGGWTWVALGAVFTVLLFPCFCPTRRYSMRRLAGRLAIHLV
jgi:iron(III) transport system permease protein